MFMSFLKLGLRNLFGRNRLYSIINVIGLAIGLASLWLVSLFIYDEYNFDNHYSNTDRIYRIVLDFTSDGNVTSWAKTSAPIGRYLHGMFPEIEHVARIRKNPGTDLLSVNEKQFYESQLFFADSTFFQLFDIPFLQGNRDLALSTKNSIVITASLAQKYFGTTDVLGKSIRYDHQLDLKITGVMQEMAHNSHFIADAIVTFSCLQEMLGEKRLAHWGQFDHYTYILLTEGASPESLKSKFPELLQRHAPEWVQQKETLLLQPLRAIHLQSDRKDEITPNSNERYSFILGTIAFLILLMACVNFINLTTATQLSRTREVAIQKALGANTRVLALYFFFESTIICAGALVLSFVLAQLTIPYLNLITGKEVDLLTSTWLFIPAIGIASLISLLTGLFPAMQSSKVMASQLGKSVAVSSNRSKLRSLLVVFQFSLSIFLIIATWIVFDQLTFLHHARYGFDSKNVIVIPIKDRSQNDRFKTLSHELEELPGVSKAAFSSSTPGANNSLTYTYTFSGSELGEQPIATFIVDDNFLELYKINLKTGRLLNPMITDTLADVIVNEAAIKTFRLKDPIGQLVTGKVKGLVVGIVENFNHASLHDQVQPVIMYTYIPTLRFVSVKLTDVPNGIAALDQKWPQLYDGYPLEYDFLNDQIQQLYGAELQLMEAYTSFSIIAIIIAGVGLIGLTTYLLNRKKKEISIRKVFGGSTLGIIFWVYGGYKIIIAVASLSAGLLAYYLMSNWLSEFSYRIELNLYYFIIPPLLMTFILLLTTGFQTVLASAVNPVIYLREN